jgi:hypothetical protein
MVVPPIQSISGDNDGFAVVYISLHGWHARFAMPAMCGASAVEITQLLINSHYFGVSIVSRLCLWQYPIF